MKLGTENRKQVIALAVLGRDCAAGDVHEYWPIVNGIRAGEHADQCGQAAASGVTRRTASGKMVPIVEPRLDPTLDLSLLKQSEEIKYAGNGRNIFVAGSVATIEPLKGNGTTDHKRVQAAFHVPPAIPPGSAHHAEVFWI